VAVARKTWLAGVGVYDSGRGKAANKFDQIFVEGSAFINDLLEKGESVESKLKAKLEARKMFKDKISALKAKLGLGNASRDQQIDVLSQRVDSLIEVVAKLAQQEKPVKKTPAKTAIKPVAKAPANKATAKPAAAKPKSDKPAAAKPVAVKSVTAKPAAVKSVAAKPAAVKSVAAKPAAVKPVVAKPAAVKPAAAKSAAPIATKPVASKPAADDKN